MGTGYTDGVATGKVTDFTEYAMQCARAFGACVMLRDEPMSSEIPEFKPSTHHAENLERAKQALADFNAMTREQRRAMADREYEEAVSHAKKAIAEKRERLSRYESMLEQARAFEPPTAEHEEYARFLVSQLEESIKFDCDCSYYEERMTRKRLDIWEAEKRKSLRWDLSYHAKGVAEEEARTASRNTWVQLLRAALTAKHEGTMP